MDLKATITRRKLVQGGLLAFAYAMLPGVTIAGEAIGFDSTLQPKANRAALSGRPEGLETARSLSLFNLHTHESLSTVYCKDGRYVSEALRRVNYFFRDFRTNGVKAIDPHLLDLLYRINLALKTESPFSLISGYRSPSSNAWLASHSEGVSHHSLHMEGRAADINVQGCKLEVIQSVALAMRGGGVGYYPSSNFVHVDTGRLRHWSCCGKPGSS